MRSPYTQLLTVPRHNLSFGSRAFRISAPKNWNTLPLDVRQSHSLSTFRNRLKTFCFRSAYPSSQLPVTNAPWFSFRLRHSAVYKSFTYLFTYLHLYIYRWSELHTIHRNTSLTTRSSWFSWDGVLCCLNMSTHSMCFWYSSSEMSSHSICGCFLLASLW